MKEGVQMFEQVCRNCKYYEEIKGKRQGYCRNQFSYNSGLKRFGGAKAANRCFEKKEGAKNE